ncbi:MAG: cell division protein FtsZ [Bacteroidales bacterium]|nr:cell division protein FtsZ [Bacteroidales bacterium]
MDELINFELPVNHSSIIKVVGVGGGGSNAVNHMYRLGIKDVNFVVCNTDAQALSNSPVPIKVQLGASLTEGRGAGNKPEVGKQAAIESLDGIKDALSANSRMVFITTGMGGGTGTGAAPIIAKAAKDLGILTVGIVTIPFRNEGPRRISQALDGIAEMEQYVDSLLVINNEKIREMYGDLKVSEAFSKADDVLAIAAKGIAEIITVHGFINVDFADVHTVMSDSGVAIMGSAMAEGENRAIQATQKALASPLLNDNDIKGARNILVNITSGNEEVTMDEIGQIIDYIQECSGVNADLIWGNGIDVSLGDKICVTIIATGFASNSIPELYARKREINRISLSDYETASNVRNADFEVKDKPATEKKTGDQQTLEFKISSTDNWSKEVSRIKDRVDIKKASQRVNTIKKNQERLKELNISPSATGDYIDELENTPAYKRKKVKIEQVKHSEETKVSQYSLVNDQERQVKLSKDNPYLHDAID